MTWGEFKLYVERKCGVMDDEELHYIDYANPDLRLPNVDRVQMTGHVRITDGDTIDPED
jgi:hypothetical protein